MVWVVVVIVAVLLGIIFIWAVSAATARKDEEDYQQYVDNCVDNEIKDGLESYRIFDYEWKNQNIHNDVRRYVKHAMIDHRTPQNHKFKDGYEFNYPKFHESLYKKIFIYYKEDQKYKTPPAIQD